MGLAVSLIPRSRYQHDKLPPPFQFPLYWRLCGGFTSRLDILMKRKKRRKKKKKKKKEKGRRIETKEKRRNRNIEEKEEE
jgi:hypothetical protein